MVEVVFCLKDYIAKREHMKNIFADKIKYGNKIHYYLRDKDMFIIKEPSKYLKHKTKQNKSYNTVKSIAFALSYYFDFLYYKNLTVNDVLNLRFSEQHEHFVEFLYWLKSGNHTEKGEVPQNKTCNMYLRHVFGFYDFLEYEYEIEGYIKVLDKQDISYSGAVGIRFKKSINNFEGYLVNESSHGRTIEKEEIIALLDETNNVRNKLMILLMAETGFRIGELLGIRYSRDIDYDNHTIKVEYREDNENDAKAKNAEIRHAKISQETFDMLMYYISENREILSKSEYLFICLNGKTAGQPMTANSVYSFFNALGKKTGFKATPHMLRHYFANERRATGWTMEEISRALGHRNLATTMNYLNIKDEELQSAMEQYYAENAGLYSVDKLIG